MRIHVLEAGRLVGNGTFLRGEGFASVLRRPQPYEFPVYSYVIEHAAGHVVVDTGLASGVRVPRPMRRFAPVPTGEPVPPLSESMAKVGLRASDVRWVVATHLDWDHIGGVGTFPHAEVLVHRPEWTFARSLPGRLRYQPKLWPKDFSPSLYDLDDEPYGPFPQSRTLGEDPDFRIVPTPGHSVGHVGLVVHGREKALFFGGDHMLRADWFVEDAKADRLVQLGAFYRRRAVETSRRIRQFMTETPTVLLPAHDADASQRLLRSAPELAARSSVSR